MKKRGKQRKMEIQYAKPLVPENEILEYLRGLGFQMREISAPVNEDQSPLLHEAKKGEFTIHVGFPLPHVMFFITFFPEEKTKAFFHDRFISLLNHFVSMEMIHCYAPEEIPPKVMAGLKGMGEIHDAITGEKL